MADTRPLSERLDAAWVLAQTDSGEHVDPGLLHEAAALARKVESAQVVEVAPFCDGLQIVEQRPDRPGEYRNRPIYAQQRRVALVPVEALDRQVGSGNALDCATEQGGQGPARNLP